MSVGDEDTITVFISHPESGARAGLRLGSVVELDVNPIRRLKPSFR